VFEAPDDLHFNGVAHIHLIGGIEIDYFIRTSSAVRLARFSFDPFDQDLLYGSYGSQMVSGRDGVLNLVDFREPLSLDLFGYRVREVRRFGARERI
jgi:hypothetical protein